MGTATVKVIVSHLPSFLIRSKFEPSFSIHAIMLIGLPLAASGLGRCQINNGGCWNETRNGKTVSACSVR